MPGAEVELAPGGRGDFIVRADGDVVWDKRAMGGRYPDEDELAASLGRRRG